MFRFLQSFPLPVEAVELQLATKTQVQQTIGKSVPPRAFTRVSPDFALLRLHSPSFKSEHSFLKHSQDRWRLQVHMSKRSLSLRLLDTQTQLETHTDTDTHTHRHNNT